MNRETFGTRLGALATMIGIAVGLGNVWRFPYMVGQFGGAAFVMVYVGIVAVIGVPALTAEWTLGRQTRRGTLGAFELGGLRFGRTVGWFFFAIITVATGYYTNVVGWVLFHAIGTMGAVEASAIIPPEAGVRWTAVGWQVLMTGALIGASAVVLSRGLRGGMEWAARRLMPVLVVILLVLIARSLTLEGAGAGVRWYIGKFAFGDITPGVVLGALGQATFSLGLGGTLMVVCGSYLAPDMPLGRNAIWTAAGDTGAGLLAGFAILPAVIALGLEPTSGPGLLFETLPAVFAAMPGGALFGFLFYVGLLGVALLSSIGAFEVQIRGLTDNTSLTRAKAIRLMAVVVFVIAVPPMFNLGIFVPWDLTFGSGMQTLGALVTAVTVGWAMVRADAVRQLGSRTLYLWIRFVIPAAMSAVGIWWLTTEVFGA